MFAAMIERRKTSARCARAAWLSALLCIVASSLTASTVAAEPGSDVDTQPSRRSGAPTTTVPAIPPLFGYGPQQVGLLLGFGRGIKFAGSGRTEGHQVRELIMLPYWQIELTRRPVEPVWYKGTLGFRAEATILVNFEPRTGVAGGLGLLLRYSWTRWDPIIPYVQAGAGVIGLDFDLAKQANGLAFIPQAGLGLVYRLDRHFSFDLGFRFHHISNAETDKPNGGIDTLQVLAGAAYHF
jgi:opacity protein-like surface antigen